MFSESFFASFVPPTKCLLLLLPCLLPFGSKRSVMEDVYPDFETKQIGDRIDISPRIRNPSTNARESNSSNNVEFTGSAADELKKFAELKNAGVITEAEFEEKKRKLLE